MKHKFLLLYSWFVRTLLYFLPDIPIIMRFRGWMYGLGMMKCGKNFQVTHDTIIKGLQNIEVGSSVFVGNHTIIMGHGYCVICDLVQIAPHCVVISSNHSSINGSYRYGKCVEGKIHIGVGSWIAANCTLVSGAKLPANSVLAANSILNKCFDVPNSIYAGSPAKFIKEVKTN